MPFTVGGGIRDAKDIRQLLLAGADKVSINTIAVTNPKIITEASNIFGSQCVVVAIDAKRIAHSAKRKAVKWEVYINGGRTPTGIEAVSWAKKAEKLGAGEILLTSMDYDGTKNGFDIELTKAISGAVSIPVIASGGAGLPAHFYEVLNKTKATAALAASIFHYREYRVKEVKEYIKKKGVRVRI
jgi:cyclase